ncbi:MAG: TIGR04141 family sporadically distributed protein [Candidatus Hydrogenedentes bacterium]|nr:TIGR04141 family sporadically distributed protein [Candidatus Hydrogenedentota bacterium]
MKLSIYLLRDSVTSFEAALRDKYLEGDDGFRELSPSLGLPYECKAFVQSNVEKAPKWLSFLSSHFDTEELDLRNTSNSFILLLKVRERLFGVTFGYAFNAIDRAKVEPSFGLKVSLCALDESQIRTFDTRNIDLVTRQRRTHVSAGSPVSEFDLNVDVDWVRYVQGTPCSDGLGKSISGADSLGINCDCSLDDLAAKCGELLDLYQSDAYREKFEFIDHLRPLKKTDSRISQLDAELRSRLQARSLDRIAVACPELPDYEQLDCYRCQRWHTKSDMLEVSLQTVYRFLDESPDVSTEPDQISIIGLDANGNPVTHRRKLREYLVCEVEKDGNTYVLSMGQWFEANTDYVQKVRREVARIPDISSVLDLPPIAQGEREDTYNARVASSKGWLVLDKRTFQIENTYDKIEICDLITDTWQLICVKKMSSSATLSHLFSQGSVSLSLLRGHEEYRQHIIDAVAEKWYDMDLTPERERQLTVVYAVPTPKEGGLADCMFFFSLINLLNHARIIRTLGYNLALCKILYQ